MNKCSESEQDTISPKDYYELEKKVIKIYQRLFKKNQNSHLLNLVEIKGSVLNQKKEY